MSDAKFKINGTLFATKGYDGAAAQVISLELEDSPALDVHSCVYSVVAASKSAPALVLSNGGVASPPTAAVTFTLPAGCNSYLLRCQVNGGEAIRVAGQLDYAANTKHRIVAVRSTNHALRKWVISETSEYSEGGGMADAQNEEVDAVDLIGGGGTYVAGTDLTESPAFTFNVRTTTIGEADRIPKLEAVTSGLTVGHVKSAGTVASAGLVRGANATTLAATRNAANSRDIPVVYTTAGDALGMGDILGTASHERQAKTGGFWRWIVNSVEILRINASEILFGATVSTPSIGQTQHATGAGAMMTAYAQQGAPGFVGGVKRIGGGRGGTSGVNLPGNLEMSLGVPVAGVSAKASVTVSDVSILDIYQAAAGAARVQAAAGTQLWLDGGNVIKLMVAGASYLDVGASVTGALTFTTSSDVWFHAGLAAPKLAQRTRGDDTACSDFTFQPQQPFATATTTNRKPGNNILDLGTPTNGGTTQAKESIQWRGGRAKSERLNGHVQTTDATPTDIPFALPDATIGGFLVQVTARAAATGSSAAWLIAAAQKRHGGGVATTVGTNAALHTALDAALSTATASVSTTGASNDLIVQVRGVAATTIEWTVHIVAALNTP